MTQDRQEPLFRTVREAGGRGRKGRKEAPPTPVLPLTGREDEVEQLVDAVRQSAAGTPAFVFVGGEAGVGKSRLLAELARRCRPLHVRAFLLAPTERPVPYALFSQLLSDLAKVYFPGRPVPEGVPDAILALLRDDAPRPQDPGAVNGAIRAFLTSLSRVTPLMVLVDDLPRVDAESLATIHFLARVMRPDPETPPRVGLVLAFRPDALAASDMARELMAQVVSLGGVERTLSRLGAPGLASLVKAAFPDKEVDDRLLSLIAEQSQGNPLFALSLLDLLRSDGHVSEEGAIVRLVSDRIPKLPSGLVDIVLRRLADLPERERRLLALGSVCGTRLDADLLAEGLGWQRNDVLASLKGLARRGRLVRMSDGAFDFDPAVSREVIYQELTPQARRAFHGLAAAHLVRKRGEGAEHAMELATHLDRAGRPAEAAAHYLSGGRLYRKRFAWSLARDGFSRFLEIASAPSPERAEALLGLTEALLELGQVPDAEAPLSEATDLGKTLALDLVRGNSIMLSARRLFLLGDTRAALVAAKLAEQTFQSHAEESALARVVELKGAILHRSGATEEGEIALEAALLLFTKVGDRAGRCAILLSLATMARETARHERALSYIEQALDAAREIEDPRRQVEAIHQAGITRWMKGERTEGQELIRQAVRLAQRYANPRLEATALADLSYALGEEGDMDAAIAAATEARDLWRALAERPAEARSHALLASLFARRGPLEEARAYGTASEMILAEVGDRRTRAWVLAVLAQVALATGDLDQAQKLATESLGLSEQIDDHLVSGQALSVLGTLLLDRGDARKGRELLDRAVADLRAARAVTFLPLAQATLGRAVYLEGDKGRGLKMLQEAMTEADQLGSSVARAETTLEFGRTLPAGSPQAQMVLEGALDVARGARLFPLVDKLSALLEAQALG